MRENRVLTAYREGRTSFGLYVGIPSTRIVEMLGGAGYDFIRIQYDDAVMNIESVEHMIHTAHAVGITPFVRVPRMDERVIGQVLKAGAMGIQIPHVRGREDVEAAVRAVKGSPIGRRAVLPSGFSGDYGRVDYQTHLEWANEHIMLGVQIETREAVKALDEIASVPGLDMLLSGRGDLSYEYGVPGQGDHPLVVEAQQKMINAGLSAGKIVSVVYSPLRDPENSDRIRNWIQRGVQCIALGGDRDIASVYRRMLADVRNREATV